MLVYEKHDLSKQVVIKARQSYTAQKGAVKHDDVIKNRERYGTKVYTSNKRGFLTILKPTSDMYTRNLS